jgi:hypothetical protein
MTIQNPKRLAPEELACLIELALTNSPLGIPPDTLAKLIALGYVAMTENGLLATGDGLMAITESE